MRQALRRPAAITRVQPRTLRLVLLCALTVQFLAVGAVQAWRDAPTYDENYYVPVGVTVLTRQQLRLTLHPPLPYAVAAAPALLARPVIPRGTAWERGEPNAYAAQFMGTADRTGKMRRLVFLARLVPLLEGAAVGLLLFLLGSRLFGPNAGLAAAAGWLTLPFAVGMSHIVGLDIAMTLATVVCSLALLCYLRARTLGRALALGAATGLALLCSFAAFALLAAVTLAVVWRRPSEWSETARHVAVVLLTVWVAVWVGYRVLSPSPDFQQVDPAPTVASPLPARVMRLAPWPQEFETGFDSLLRTTSDETPAFILGREWNGRRWWYWPAAAVVKLPATALVLLSAGILFALTRRNGRRELWLAIGGPLLAILATTVSSASQIGLRYLLPAIALGLVLAGGALAAAWPRRVGRVVVVALLVAQLGWFWESYPRSLAWTAPPFRPGYRHATDSNVDWGQDLYRLRAWARGRPMYVEYLGGPGSTAGWPAARPFNVFDRGRELPFTLVVSASNLTGIGREYFGWLRAYCPIDVIGDTLLVYRFDKLELSPDVPARPPSVCEGTLSHRVAGDASGPSR